MSRAKIYKLVDGIGFSPDGGRGIVIDNVIYWKNGDTTDLNVGGLLSDVRWLPEKMKLDWSPETITREGNSELAYRLFHMTKCGEVGGRMTALKEAAKRLFILGGR